ncbi:unnamed protein product [Prunus armeniaca]
MGDIMYEQVDWRIEGLGFRDLEAFNKALLAKQSWRLFFNCNSLAARIFKARYFPHCNFLEARLRYRPSLIWSSLIWGKDLLKVGLRLRVEIGEDIHVYQDWWVPLPMNFKIILAPQFDASMKEVKAILQIPLASIHREDKLIWHYDRSGKYSVRSDYMVACMKKQRENGMERPRHKMMEFYSVNLALIRSHSRQGPNQSSVNWHAPLDGQYKINVNGAAKLDGLVQGVGAVICNGNREFMAACSRQMVGHFSAQAMALIRAKKGLQFAYDLGFHDIVLEMDAQGAVDRINSNEECFEVERNLVEDIKEMQGWFRSFSCN